ncbi:MAG: transposase [Roseibium album]|uniref:IS66-like element accessory protein TnpA n=1 Tax=Roseibium album TaxID=311410 RepID=UPI0032F009C6
MGRIEILTSRERRRFWSEDQKVAILEEVAASGLTVAEVARRHDVLPQQIYTWRRKLSCLPENEARFLPLTLVAGDPELTEPAPEEEAVRKPSCKKASRTWPVEIRCKGGRTLKVDAGLDPLLLQALIRAVEAA